MGIVIQSLFRTVLGSYVFLLLKRLGLSFLQYIKSHGTVEYDFSDRVLLLSMAILFCFTLRAPWESLCMYPLFA